VQDSAHRSIAVVGSVRHVRFCAGDHTALWLWHCPMAMALPHGIFFLTKPISGCGNSFTIRPSPSDQQTTDVLALLQHSAAPKDSI
jgi:hypothetical protein